MPSVWMNSFEWDGLSEILARPAAELAERLRRKQGPGFKSRSSLPQDEVELVRFLETLLASDDWYAGKSLRDARAVDDFVYDVFFDKARAKTLGLEALNDGVISELLEIAKGNLMVDAPRNTPRSRQFFITKVKSPPELDLPELSELGSRPFRHPAWNRKLAEQQLARHNPFVEGAEIVYFPEYSIHSPEQVNQLQQDLGRVTDRVRSELERIKSKTVRSEVNSNFDEFIASVQQAALAGRAVCAWQDS